MANYYTHFCVGVELRSEAERKWAYDQLEGIAPLEWDRCGPDDDPNFDVDENEFDYEISGESFAGEEDKRPVLYLLAGESGNPYKVAKFLQAFLRKFDPQGGAYVTFAEVCDKDRPDAFSGGAYAVTAEQIEFIHASSWVASKLAEHNIRVPDRVAPVPPRNITD